MKPLPAPAGGKSLVALLLSLTLTTSSFPAWASFAKPSSPKGFSGILTPKIPATQAPLGFTPSIPSLNGLPASPLPAAAAAAQPPASSEFSGLTGNHNDLSKRVWRHAERQGFADAGQAVDAAPSAGAPLRSGGAVITMAELLRRKTISDIRKEIFEISHSVNWSRWLYEITSYLDDNDKDNVFLVTDANDRIEGFLLLGHGYNSDDKRTTSYEGAIYIAYMAVRRDPSLKGVGKKLFLEVTRRAKLQGEGELVLHVKQGDAAYGFYQAMSKYVPIKEETDDTTYVAGETWIRMTFDLTDFKVEVPAVVSTTRAKPATLRSWTTLGFLGSFVASELWIEATAFAIPLLSRSISHGFAGMAAIGAIATGALGLGSLAGGPAVNRFGIRKVYVSMFVLRTALAAGLVYLYDSQHWNLGLLSVLMGLAYFSIGISRVAEATFPIAQFGSSIIQLNRFGTWQLRAIALVGVFGAAAVAATIASAGFGAMLSYVAAAMAVGCAVAFISVKPPRQVSGFKNGDLLKSLRVLRQNPMLRSAAVGFGIPSALLFFLYLLVFPAFGMYVAADTSAIAAVMAWMAALYSASGFAGAWASDWLTKRAAARLARLTEVPVTQHAAALQRIFLQSTRRWLVAAGLSLLGLWALAVATPVAGILLAYIAISVIGFAATGATVQSESLLRSGAPEGIQGTFLGVVRALVMAATAVGFIPLGLIFQPLSSVVDGAIVPKAGAFLILGLLVTGAATWLLRLPKSLRSNLHASNEAPLPALPALAPQNGAAPSDAVTTLRELATRRPLEKIKEEIRALSAHASFGPWQDVVDSYLAQHPSRVLLVTDPQQQILGFLMLDDRITTDWGQRTVLPGPSYIAYMAARPDTQGRGIGKKLLLEAARVAKRHGPELILHVEADSPAVNFYRAIGKYLPIKSEAPDRRYVAGTPWIKFVFDVTNVH